MDTQQIAQALYRLFGPDLELLARQTGFVRRASPVTGVKFALIWVLGLLEKPDASLEFLTQVGDDLGVSVTRQALQGRLARGAVAFLRRLFERAQGHLRQVTPLPLACLAHFRALMVLDSTQLALPDAFAADWPAAGGSGPQAGFKLQVLWDFLRNALNVQVTSAREPDQRYVQRFVNTPTRLVVPGGLILYDLGYFVLKSLRAIAEAQAYFLCRYYPAAKVYDPHTGAEFDLLTCLRTQGAAGTERVTRDVCLGARERIPCRVLAVRVPEEVALARQLALARRIQHKHQRDPQPASLAWQHWNVYVTNVPAAWLTFDEVVLLYVLRWQIELLFRLWKHEDQLTRQAGQREERIWCEVYAKLTALLVFHDLTSPLRSETLAEEGELSWPKAFQVLGRHVRELAQTLGAGGPAAERLPEVLTLIYTRWLKRARQEPRRTRLSSYRQVERGDLAAYYTRRQTTRAPTLTASCA